MEDKLLSSKEGRERKKSIEDVDKGGSKEKDVIQLESRANRIFTEAMWNIGKVNIGEAGRKRNVGSRSNTTSAKKMGREGERGGTETDKKVGVEVSGKTGFGEDGNSGVKDGR